MGVVVESQPPTARSLGGGGGKEESLLFLFPFWVKRGGRGEGEELFLLRAERTSGERKRVCEDGRRSLETSGGATAGL